MEKYKKIIKSRDLRKKILNVFRFIPDEPMIKIQYFVKTGRILNLKDPKRYTEKIQWYKLNYREPILTTCSDKYEVRTYVEEKGLGFLLNKLYTYYEDVNEIDYSKLPNSFVLKSTTGSGNNLLVKDKKNLSELKLKNVVSSWLENKDSQLGREWAYYDIKPRVIVEKMLPRDSMNDLPDYKFFCFNGKVKYLYTMINYVDNHDEGQCSFFTPDFIKLPYKRSEFKAIDEDISPPKNFNRMIEYAEILSKDFPHVRVDFYNIDGDIVFGELTFYNASGYTVFEPDEFDFMMGNEFLVPKRMKKVGEI